MIREEFEPSIFRDPHIPDGEKSMYRIGITGQPGGLDVSHVVVHNRGAYHTTLEVGSGDSGQRGLSMTIEQRISRIDGRLHAETYRAQTLSGTTVVSREEANFADTVHLQFGGLPQPFPANVMPIAGGLTLLRGLEFADGLVETVDAWLSFSVHWPLLVRVEKQVVFAGPAGVFPCWQVRMRPGFDQVNPMLDKMVGSVVPPFLALFEVAEPHRLVQVSFPTQMSMSAPRATMELVS
ncbi:hypothetical protein ACFWU5_20975 [Nocardia sp. NPDC058640]|uniref:hypothetical protein n=1 Tax=Nocardia sp. NPDC058640 TaxID=3346571 RepID=UPI00365128AF